MIKNKQDSYEMLKLFLEEKSKEQDDFDYGYGEHFNYEYLLEHLDESNLKVLIYGNKILGLYTYKSYDDIDIIYLDIIDESKTDEILEDIKNNHYHPIFDPIQNLYKNEQMFDVNKESKFLKGSEYQLDGYLSFKDDINLLRDYLDKKNFPEYDGSNLIFRVSTVKEFYDNIRNSLCDRWSEERYQNGTAIGFHYLGNTYDDAKGDDKMLQIYDNDNLVGIIKYGIYKEFSGDEKYSLCYIDVKNPYRGNGISKLLIEEFGKQLAREDKSLPLYVTGESDMGKTCHIKDTCIELIKDRIILYDNFTKREQFLNGEDVSNIDLLELKKMMNDREAEL